MLFQWITTRLGGSQGLGVMRLRTVYKGKNTPKGQSEAYQSVLSGEGVSRGVSMVLVQEGGEGEKCIAVML